MWTRTSRSKRKMERKVGSGRKGTVDEEEYLLKSLTRLAARFVTIQGMITHAFVKVSTSTRDDLDEVRNLPPHLLQFTPEHHKEGMAMQKHLANFGEELKRSLLEVWMKPAEETPIDSWATCNNVPSQIIPVVNDVSSLPLRRTPFLLINK
ncbi:hypothetical protein C0992_009639 [Termitomyces sp. T32_za158]|nr:hypothetical protein C0992_009639 [Termitomyces sp. T32_za158]